MDGAVADTATATALERSAALAVGVVRSLTSASELAQAGRPQEAFARLDEFVALEAQHPERPSFFGHNVLNLRGDAHHAAGEYPEAMRWYLLSMRQSADDGDTLQLCYDLAGLAAALIDNADFGAGLETVGMARAASVELYGAASLADQTVGADCLERAESAAGAAGPSSSRQPGWPFPPASDCRGPASCTPLRAREHVDSPIPPSRYPSPVVVAVTSGEAGRPSRGVGPPWRTTRRGQAPGGHIGSGCLTAHEVPCGAGPLCACTRRCSRG